MMSPQYKLVTKAILAWSVAFLVLVLFLKADVLFNF